WYCSALFKAVSNGRLFVMTVTGFIKYRFSTVPFFLNFVCALMTFLHCNSYKVIELRSAVFRQDRFRMVLDAENRIAFVLDGHINTVFCAAGNVKITEFTGAC